MITSINRNELYKVLMGRENPYKNNPAVLNGDTGILNDDNTINVTAENALSSDKISKFKPNFMADVSDTIKQDKSQNNRDRFERTSFKINLSADNKDRFTVDCFEASEIIDFREIDLKAELNNGRGDNIPPTKEQIAEFYGRIARRLDDALKEEKITKDEFDELDKMLLEQLERQALLTERKVAFYALGGNIGNPLDSDSPNQRLDSYSEQHCKIDRKSLGEQFYVVRYGK